MNAGTSRSSAVVLPEYDSSSASDINSAGLIVGQSISSTLLAPATLWRGGQVCKLQDLVRTPALTGQWIAAARVNERGEILAFLESSPVGAGWFVLTKH